MKKRHFPYLAFCAKQRQQHLLRQLPKDSQYKYDFSTNDYLGLNQHPQLVDNVLRVTPIQGVGAMGSRLLITSQHALKALEGSVAHAKHMQSALIFATGFQANVSVLSALLDPRILGKPPLVFSDKLNHASMHMACGLNNIKQHRYHHLDMEHLAWWLARTKEERRPRFILTESVFGMDGDVADLSKLIQLAKDYDAFLYVDEAHATGLFGLNGYGLSSNYGREIDLVMGTFSKALGTSGAYIACSSTLKRFLINRCLGLIYSTAPPPMQVAAMQAAWDSVPAHQVKVKQLFVQAKALKQRLDTMGFSTGTSTTHIIPIIMQEPKKVLKVQQILAKQGIRVSAIRPPSVLPTQSRLRIALNVNHTFDAIEALLSALRFCTHESNLIG